MNNKELKLEAKVADTLALVFKDPIDMPCPYCGAARAVIPIIRAGMEKEIEEYDGSYIDDRFWKSKFWKSLQEGEA